MPAAARRVGRVRGSRAARPGGRLERHATPNPNPNLNPNPNPNPNPNLTPIPTVTLTLARTRHHESLADCSVVLEQSRRCHFGALSGAGLVHLELHKEAQARAQEARPPGESVVANHHRRLEHEASSTP